MTLLLDVPASRHSALCRLDPRWKLAALGFAILAVALIQTPGPALAAFAASLILVWAARLPTRWYAGRVGAALLVPLLLALGMPWTPHPTDAVAQVGGAVVSLSGLARALTLLAKVAAIVSLMLVLLATAPVHETFKAAQSLYAPAWLVQLALLSYRYVFLLAEEFARLRTALRVRGYRNRAGVHSYRTIGQVTGTLLVRGHERSERVGQAMRCRGFDGRFRALHDFRTRAADVLFLAGAVLAAAALLAWDWGSRLG